MGGKMSRAAKISRHDSDTDLFDQNLTSVNTLQTTSNNSLSNSGSRLGNQQQTTALPALSFTRIPQNSNRTLTVTGSNSNSVPEINEDLDLDQLTNSTGEMMYEENSELEESTEQPSTSEELDNLNSLETNGQNLDELTEQNSETELIFQSSHMEKRGQNLACESNEQSNLPEWVPQNSLSELTDEDSSSENPTDSENANQTHELFIPAYMAEETTDNADASMMSMSEESLSVSDTTSPGTSESSIADQTLQNATSTNGVELLHSSESKILQDGVVSMSSSTDSLTSSEQLIQDIEDYNNNLQDSSTDLSEEYFEIPELSVESELFKSDVEGLTESEQELEFRSSLKQMMDKAISPGAGAVVSSDTQCCCLTSEEQTITENTDTADTVARNCVSEGEICHSTSTPTSPELNNKRKNDGDVQDESQSKRLALDMADSTENDIEMEVVDMD